MIFVTVGTQLPFDRLVHAVDRWAERNGRRDVFAQVGPTEAPPAFIEHASFLEPDDVARRFDEATLVIGHAGMGTIISALQRRKPVLVMARKAEFREQRNDHQLATVERFQQRGWIHAAADEHELDQMLERIDELTAADQISAAASPELLQMVQRFVLGTESNPQRKAAS